jgi:hypothetical protein
MTDYAKPRVERNGCATGNFLKQDLARNTELIHVNVRAPMMLAHEIGKRMVARGRGGIFSLRPLSDLWHRRAPWLSPVKS